MNTLQNLQENIINELETILSIYCDEQVVTHPPEITSVPKHSLCK